MPKTVETKTAGELLFNHYLRTGERLYGEAAARFLELKANMRHYQENGQFARAGEGVLYGSGTGEGGSLHNGNVALSRTPRMPAPAGRQTTRPPTRMTNSHGSRSLESTRSSDSNALGILTERASRMAITKFKQLRSLALSSQPPVKTLLHQIARGEGVDDGGARSHGFASSYDVPFNYGRYARQSKPLTQMTLGEIDLLQARMAANPANQSRSTPVGRYQLVRATLRELKVQLGLDENTIFNETTQDMLGAKLLERRGIFDYMNGRISESEFQRRMAAEWASIEMPQTGRTRTGQRLGTSTAQILPIIRAIRPK